MREMTARIIIAFEFRQISNPVESVSLHQCNGTRTDSIACTVFDTREFQSWSSTMDYIYSLCIFATLSVAELLEFASQVYRVRSTECKSWLHSMLHFDQTLHVYPKFHLLVFTCIFTFSSMYILVPTFIIPCMYL